MVEPDIRPVRRDVAVVARCVGLDVVGRLAPRGRIVVTGRARGGRAGVIEAHARPACRYVTGIAVRIGRNVPEGLSRRDRIVVAIAASRWQCLEVSIRMAAVAADRPVRPIEGEAGREVIELDDDHICIVLRMSRRDNARGSQHQDGNCERRQHPQDDCGKRQSGYVRTAVGHRTVLTISDSAQ